MRIFEWNFRGTADTGETGSKEHAYRLSRESEITAFLAALLAVAGILLRLQRFFLGRSFRGDEAAIGLAIPAHSLWDLLSNPIAHMTAPPGFLLIEKLIVSGLGTQDFIFRIFPLLTGMLAVLLIYVAARTVVGGVGAVFCIGAFAFNWMAAFYASDVKQYSSDVFFALLIYLASARYFDSETASNALWLGITGLVAIPFAHPAIFLLACVTPVLLLHYRRKRSAVWRVLTMGSIWVAAFGMLYFWLYRSVGQQAYIVDYWNDLNGLMPMPPWQDPSWFVIRTSSFITTVLNLTPALLIPLALYAVGLFSFYRRGKWQWGALLLGSALVALLASAVANYPFKGRLILFLIPSALLTIGEGIEWVSSRLMARNVLSRVVGWFMVLFLLWTPAATILYQLQQPRSSPYPEDIKPALAFVQANKQPGDMIIVYDQAEPTYRFYAPFYGLSSNPTLYLPDYRRKPNKYRDQIDLLPKNQRIWFIFSAVISAKGQLDERSYMLDYVRSIGGQVLQQQFVADGISSAHLTIIR